MERAKQELGKEACVAVNGGATHKSALGLANQLPVTMPRKSAITPVSGGLQWPENTQNGEKEADLRKRSSWQQSIEQMGYKKRTNSGFILFF